MEVEEELLEKLDREKQALKCFVDSGTLKQVTELPGIKTM